MLAADQVQHHVHRRGAAGRGEAVAVDGEQAGAHGHPGEGFLHRRQAFPVHAAIVAVEQAGAGQRPTAGAHRAEAPTLAGLGLEERDVLAGDAALDADAAADDHAIHRRGVVGTGVGGDLQAVAGPDLAAVQAQRMPAVEFASRELVGHAQRFHRRGQGDQGEVIQQQEADGLRISVLWRNSGRVRGHGCISSR